MNCSKKERSVNALDVLCPYPTINFLQNDLDVACINAKLWVEHSKTQKIFALLRTSAIPNQERWAR
jgi:hypothetical protein